MLIDSEYQLLDSGDGLKFEEFGAIKVIRPAAQAIWKKRNPDSWKLADAIFNRDDSGSGRWEFIKPIPESWFVKILGINYIVKCTSFGHMGVFPEAYTNWIWLQNYLTKHNASDLKILSLFSYTGAYSLVCAEKGAEVCHVDASKTVVSWARENAIASDLQDKPVRWIVDDVRKFVQREVRRGKKYDGLIMDPPTYGRGNKGELWKIEEHLSDLIKDCCEVLSESPKFFMLNTYAGDITSSVLKNLLMEHLPESGNIENGEMLILEKNSKRSLPNGMTAVWSES